MNHEGFLQNAETPEINREEIVNEVIQHADLKDVRTLSKALPQTLTVRGLKKEKQHWVDKTGKVVIDATTYLDILNMAAVKFPRESPKEPDEFEEAMTARKQPKTPPESSQKNQDYWWKKGQYE